MFKIPQGIGEVHLDDEIDLAPFLDHEPAPAPTLDALRQRIGAQDEEADGMHVYALHCVAQKTATTHVGYYKEEGQWRKLCDDGTTEVVDDAEVAAIQRPDVVVYQKIKRTWSNVD